MSISRWGMSKCMCCSAIRPNSRVVANPDMHPFWGNFRVGGNTDRCIRHNQIAARVELVSLSKTVT
jgi:hypothetical protein